MLKCHTELQDAVFQLAKEDLDALLLNASLERRVDNFLAKLSEINGVDFKFQIGGCSS